VKSVLPLTSTIYEVGSESFLPDQLFKVTNKTTLLFFNTVSLYFNTYWYRYINLTLDGAIYPSQHFPFGAAFVCQTGNFWIPPSYMVFFRGILKFCNFINTPTIRVHTCLKFYKFLYRTAPRMVSRSFVGSLVIRNNSGFRESRKIYYQTP